MATYIDLSVDIENNEHTDHPGGSPKVKYLTHDQTASGLASFFPGLEPEELPDGEGWAVENVTLSTHNGTYIRIMEKNEPRQLTRHHWSTVSSPA